MELGRAGLRRNVLGDSDTAFTAAVPPITVNIRAEFMTVTSFTIIPFTLATMWRQSVRASSILVGGASESWALELSIIAGSCRADIM